MNAILFYEDSEGDLNVMSDEQDIKVAQSYSRAKNHAYLKCSLMPRETFHQIRDEQNSSEHNRSKTYEREDQHFKKDV